VSHAAAQNHASVTTSNFFAFEYPKQILGGSEDILGYDFWNLWEKLSITHPVHACRLDLSRAAWLRLLKEATMLVAEKRACDANLYFIRLWVTVWWLYRPARSLLCTSGAKPCLLWPNTDLEVVSSSGSIAIFSRGERYGWGWAQVLFSLYHYHPMANAHHKRYIPGARPYNPHLSPQVRLTGKLDGVCRPYVATAALVSHFVKKMVYVIH